MCITQTSWPEGALKTCLMYSPRVDPSPNHIVLSTVMHHDLRQPHNMHQ